MKSNKILLGIALSMLSVTACDSVLDVEPPFNKEGSQIFKNLEEYDYALTGAYALLRQEGYFGAGGQTTSTWANLPDMMGTDLVRTTEDLANWQTQVDWTYTADENDIEVAWQAAYRVIAQANLVIRNIDRFASENSGGVNRVKGQALALRGMAHFDLFRFWAESYDRNSSAKGIPFVEVVDVNSKPSRLTVQQSYDKIFADLEAAETLLGSTDKAVNSSSSRAYIDQLVVKALLARLNLYAKDYTKAESYATQVIDARPLATSAQFPAIWTDASNAEVIWSVAFNLGEGVPAVGVHIASTNRNRFKPSAALEATYDQTNDVRFSTYFGTRLSNNNVSRRIVKKFYGRNAAPPTASDNIVNWKALRTAEMYLIRAEARAMQGGAKEVEALLDLNTLRAARINSYVAVDLSGAALLDAIALERRKELLAEGHQWFDLKRTTKTINRPAGDGHLESTPLTLAASAREWNWPIPTKEVNANDNLAAQQTVGY